MVVMMVVERVGLPLRTHSRAVPLDIVTGVSKLGVKGIDKLTNALPPGPLRGIGKVALAGPRLAMQAVGAIGEGAKKAMGGIAKGVKGVIGGIGKGLNGVGKGIGKVFSGIGGLFKPKRAADAAKRVGSAVGGAVRGVGNAAKSVGRILSKF